MNEDKQKKIVELTGLTLEQIILLTEGEFTRRIWILYFKHILSEKQYLWLRTVRRKKVAPELQDVLDIIGGELI